jgi:hypothetical protein
MDRDRRYRAGGRRWVQTDSSRRSVYRSSGDLPDFPRYASSGLIEQ